MRPIDADEIKEDFSEILERNYEDDYARGFQAALIAVLGYKSIAPPPNDPLTPEELREMDGEPVWCVVYNSPSGGHYCLCDRGTIMTPSGSLYYCRDVRDWTFYRRKPEDKT